MKKLIEIEFHDDFTPPKRFSYQKGSACWRCPFFIEFDDDYPICSLREWNERYHGKIYNYACPIRRKYLDVPKKDAQ